MVSRHDDHLDEVRRKGSLVVSEPVVPADPEVAAATALADKLLRAGGHQGRWVPVAAVALARALVKTTPGSEHGKLLAAVLRAPKLNALAAAGAVMRLAREGTTPTQGAVAAYQQQQENRRARQAAARAAGDLARAEAQARAEAEGPRAGAWVAQVLTETGTGPTWGGVGGRHGLAASARAGADTGPDRRSLAHRRQPGAFPTTRAGIPGSPRTGVTGVMPPRRPADCAELAAADRAREPRPRPD